MKLKWIFFVTLILNACLKPSTPQSENIQKTELALVDNSAKTPSWLLSSIEELGCAGSKNAFTQAFYETQQNLLLQKANSTQNLEDTLKKSIQPEMGVEGDESNSGWKTLQRCRNSARYLAWFSVFADVKSNEKFCSLNEKNVLQIVTQQACALASIATIKLTQKIPENLNNGNCDLLNKSRCVEKVASEMNVQCPAVVDELPGFENWVCGN